MSRVHLLFFCFVLWKMQTEQLDNVIFTFISLMHAFDSIISTSIMDLLAGRTKIYAARVATAAIDRFLLPAPAHSSKPAGRRCCCRSTGQTDGWTDGQSFYDACCIPRAAADHVIGNESAVPKIIVNNTINLFSKNCIQHFANFKP